MKIYFYFFLIFVSCATPEVKKSVSVLPKNPKNFSGEYFLLPAKSGENSYFENGGSSFKFLLISKDEDIYRVKESEISFYVYSSEFLESIKEKFLKAVPQKYTIIEKFRTGKAVYLDDTTIQVEYSKSFVRETSGNNLIKTVEKFSAIKPVEEIITFLTKNLEFKEGGLWVSEERSEDMGLILTWKHKRGGGLSNPKTELIYSDGVVQIYPLRREEDFFYSILTKENINTLFQSKDYLVVYAHKDKSSESEIKVIQTRNGKFSLFKNDLPLLVYKKN